MTLHKTLADKAVLLLGLQWCYFLLNLSKGTGKKRLIRNK